MRAKDNVTAKECSPNSSKAAHHDMMTACNTGTYAALGSYYLLVSDLGYCDKPILKIHI